MALSAFHRFWAGEAVSSFGTYVTLVALQFVVLQTLHGTATEVGWLTSARWLPYLAFGLLVGAVADRLRRRPVMIISDLVRASLLIAMATMGILGWLTLPLLLLMVALLGVAGLFNDAASMAFVPRLVPAAKLQRSHARLDSSDAVAQVGGPALGGVVIRLVGAPVALLVDAASYLFSAAVALSLRAVPDDPPSTPRHHLVREIGDGLHWAYRASGLRRVAIATHVWFVGQALLSVAVVPFAVLGLHLSAAQVGAALACGGLGAVLGAAITTRVGRRLGTLPTIAACHLTSAVGVATMAAATLVSSVGSSVVLLGLGQALHGLAMGASNSHEMAYRQLLTPDHLQARTNTFLRSANRGVLVVMAPIAGLIADRLGFDVALGSAAAVFVISAVALPRSSAARSELSEP